MEKELTDECRLNELEYRVLKSDRSGTFIPCLLIRKNGMQTLLYPELQGRELERAAGEIDDDTFIKLVRDLTGKAGKLSDNGFLSLRSVPADPSMICADCLKGEVKLVYQPVSVPLYGSEREAEDAFRRELLRLITEYREETPAMLSLEGQLRNICCPFGGIGVIEEKSIRRFMLKLRPLKPETSGEIILNGTELTVGKKPGLSDFVITGDPMISRLHCRLSRDGEDCFYIEDLQSANGTWVNLRRLMREEKCLIRAGDLIRLADIDFRAETEET